MIIIARVFGSLRTFPTPADWRRTLIELAWLAPTLAALSWLGGLAEPSQEIDIAALARLAAIAFFVPCLAEELIFRAGMLSANASLLRCGLAVAAFIAWHPLQVLWFGAEWGDVVLNPWFLVAVAAFGTATTRLYLATLSIWPCVAVHWLVVLAWKTLGGASPWD